MQIKIKKSTIVLAISITLIVGCCIGTFIFDIDFLVDYLLPIIIILELLGVMIENKKMIKAINPLFEAKEYQQAIDYLLSKRNTYLFEANNKGNDLNLVLAYALIGDMNKAKEIVINRKFYGNKHLFYVIFLIHLSDGNLIKAKDYADRLQKVKNKKAIQQQVTVKKILTMIETSTVNEEVLETTLYPFVKELCLKYKNGEVVTFNRVNSDEFKDDYYVTEENKKIGVTLTGIALLIAAIISPYVLPLIGLSSINILDSYPAEISYNVYQALRFSWLMLLIPVASIIFGVKYRPRGYKALGNIILGVISGILIFSSAVSSMEPTITKSNDASLLDDIIPLEATYRPTDVTIYYEGEQFDSFSGMRYNYNMTVLINDSKELEKFIDSFNDDWVLNNSEEDVFDFYGFDYSLVYCVESNSYNDSYFKDFCTYITIDVSIDDQVMIISEIYLGGEYLEEAA